MLCLGLVLHLRGKAVRLNVVTACSSCNHRKDDRLVQEVGRPTRVTPWVPSRGDLALRRLARHQGAVA